MAGPRRVSQRGRLFGSDTLFEVLAAASKRSDGPFRAIDLDAEVDATQEMVRRELGKLEALRVIEPAPDAGSRRDRPYRIGRSDLAEIVLALPGVIEAQLEGD